MGEVELWGRLIDSANLTDLTEVPGVEMTHQTVPGSGKMSGPFHLHLSQSLDLSHPWKCMNLVEKPLYSQNNSLMGCQLKSVNWQHSQQLRQAGVLIWREFRVAHLPMSKCRRVHSTHHDSLARVKLYNTTAETWRTETIQSNLPTLVITKSGLLLPWIKRNIIFSVNEKALQKKEKKRRKKRPSKRLYGWVWQEKL